MDRFDLMIEGEPWEVKELEDRDCVFAGRSGDKFAWQIRKKLADALEQVWQIYGRYLETLDVDELARRGVDWARLVVYFDAVFPSMIYSGEIGRYAIKHTAAVMEITRNDLKAQDILYAPNDWHEYIHSPVDVIADWEATCTPSQVFSHVSGLIAVSEEHGYAMVRSKDVDRYFQFRKISKGQIKVGLRMWPTGLFYTSVPSNVPTADIDQEVVPVVHLGALKLGDPQWKGKPDGLGRSRKLAGKPWYVLHPKRLKKKGPRLPPDGILERARLRKKRRVLPAEQDANPAGGELQVQATRSSEDPIDPRRA